MKNRFYKDFSICEIERGFNFMYLELLDAPRWINNLFELVKSDFLNNEFTYDGATFVTNRSENTPFEVAAFIHDWLNYNGIVSYNVDKLMFIIMKELKYKNSLKIQRWFLTRFTFVNIIRHKIKGTYKGSLPIEILI